MVPTFTPTFAVRIFFILPLFCLWAGVFLAQSSSPARAMPGRGLVFYAPFDGSELNLVGWDMPRSSGARLVAGIRGNPRSALRLPPGVQGPAYGTTQLAKRHFSISLFVRVPNNGRTLSVGAVARLFSSWVEFVPSGPATVLPAGWHHLSFMVRSGNYTCFVDGQQISSGTVGLTSVEPKLHLRRGPMETFTLDIDELRIYNRALLPGELNTLREAHASSVPSLTEKSVAPATSIPTVTLYPNPADRWIALDFSDRYPGRQLEIVDAAGRSYVRGRYPERHARLNVAGLVPGTYYLRIGEGDRLSVHAFVKKGVVLP